MGFPNSCQNLALTYNYSKTFYILKCPNVRHGLKINFFHDPLEKCSDASHNPLVSHEIYEWVITSILHIQQK